MPSVSEKQKKFMQAVAHSPEFAKKAGVLPVFKFPSGATIITGHLASPDAFEHYQGQEFQLILIDQEV